MIKKIVLASVITFTFFGLTACSGLKDDFTHCKILSSSNPDFVARAQDQQQCFRISSTSSKNDALMQCEFLTSRYMMDKYGLIHDHVYEVSSKRC
jgi:hypothetical protein